MTDGRPAGVPEGFELVQVTTDGDSVVEYWQAPGAIGFVDLGTLDLDLLRQERQQQVGDVTFELLDGDQ